MSEQQYSTFHAGPFHFAIDVNHVQEVLQPLPCTAVPLTSDVVDGLVNLRGQIITAVDLRTRLGMQRNDEDGPAVSLIIRASSGLISLRADRLGDVFDSDISPLSAGADAHSMALEGLPDTVQGPMREVVRGIIQLRDSLLLVLDPDRLLTTEAGLAREEADSQVKD